jgi:signal transduction histidine kinase
MSHELRMPLNAVIGFAEMLQSGTFGALNDKQSEYVRDIRMSARHLLGLINTVLDMAKIESGRFELHEELIEPATLFADAVMFLDLQAKQRGVDLRDSAPADLPLMLADRRAVLQVVLNLLANAVNFTAAGGTVTLSAGTMEDGRFEIVVTDTGVGIGPECIDRIFEPFQSADASLSRKLGGAGLGLAVSKMLVERHGGELRIESTIGKGTTVYARLPTDRVVGHRSLLAPARRAG